MKRILLVLTLAFVLSVHGQNCADTVFKIGYYSSDSIYATNHISTAEQETLIIGEIKNYPFKKGLLLKLNKEGNIIWGKQLQGVSKLNLSKIIQLTDGTFVIAGVALQPNFSHAVYLAKTDGNGNLLWQNFYTLNNNSNYNEVHVYNICEGLAGDILVSWKRGGINFSVGDDHESSILMRLNPTGGVVWSKYLIVDQSNLAGMFLINGKIAVLGQAYDNTSTCFISGAGGFFTTMQLDYNTGNIEAQKNFCFQEISSNVIQSESPGNHYSSIKLENGNMALFGIFFQRNANTYYYKVLFDENLNPNFSKLYATTYSGVTHSSSSTIQILPSGESLITSVDNTAKKAFYGLVDDHENLVSQKAIDFSTDLVPIDGHYNFSFEHYNWSFKKKGNNLSFVKNHTTSNRQYIELATLHKNGDTLACLGEAANFITSLPFNITPTAWSWNNISENRIIAAAADFTISSYDLQQEVQCMLINKPFIDLGKDVGICTGDTIVLSANTSFSNYDWQPVGFIQLSNNSIQVFPSMATTYTVQANTINGCTASDTIQVDVYSRPSHFIIADTVMCAFDELSLKPFRSFSSYLWNNGTNNSYLNIDKPGNYWLQVTDQNGCKGKENIVVRPKDCPVFIYFPNAFTPNQDGKNDLFKPIVSGRFINYRFEIYNRWGQKIFYSKDPQKGWNGLVNGAMQQTGMFVWQCEYQLQGDEKKFKKGTVMLIR
ncbi:MAG TPA: gliding motility-associated C-terminal domain-containing protein [Chitinophagaceae bacterium]|jgi:gliding motility-associated-like protein|nr:gliding motility-associated C-terminal domain-containing protein [Chitinophagaceae bacterium]